MRILKRVNKKYLSVLIIIFALVLSNFFFYTLQANAITGQLSSASVQISDPRPGISGSSLTYTVKFTAATTATLKCVKILFSDTAAGTSEPTGMHTTSTAKGTVTGINNTNWTTWTNGADGAPQIEYSTGESVNASTAITIPFTNATNPTSATTFYAHITTYSNVCSTVVDTITVALATTAGIYTSVTIDPTLTFAVTGLGSGQTINSDGQTTTVVATADTIPFGTVAGGALGMAAQTLTVSTNAAGGYTVYASYSGQLTDGASHTIANAAGSNASPATFTASSPNTNSKFGYTTESTTLSNSPNAHDRFSGAKYAAFTTSGTEIAGNAYSPAPVSSEATKVGYKVAISNIQAPGTYTTTIGLVATPTY